MSTRILDLLHASQRRDLVATIGRYLLDRLFKSVNTLGVLVTQAPHDFRFDAATILRSVYDTHLQALYLMSDPQQAEPRANMFNDFATLKAFLYAKAIDDSNGTFARGVKADSH